MTGSARLDRLAALVPLAVVVVAGWALRWTDDSAFFGFRVADQIANGNGPVFNVGERVEAFTSPAWVALLWLGNGLLGFGVEWFAVVAGLALTVCGLAAACAGAALLARERDDRGGGAARRTLLLPLGALVFALLPGAWPFFSSGLDTGLSFAWLGTSFMCLALIHVRTRRGAGTSRRKLLLAAVLVGLGPLVQADFVVFSIAFVVALVVAAGRARAARPLALAGAALGLPLAYELFRMGYYAALIPNPDVAREPAGVYPSQGIRYLWDLVGAYWLWLPLAALLALGVLRWRGERDRGRRAVLAAPVVAGAAHALFVVKVGGDYMHARLLLPALFAILCPVAMVALPARRVGVALAAATCLWALVCALALRHPYGGSGTGTGSNGIVDERAATVHSRGASAHPVTAQEHGTAAQQGAAVRQRAAAGERVVTFAAPDSGAVADTPARADLPVPVVAAADAAGVFGYTAGVHAWVVDLRGAGDPLAARIELAARGLPGQEKLLAPQWVIGRFSDPAASRGDGFVDAARQAMGCSLWAWDGTGVHRQAPLRQTLAAVTEPLSVGRFLANVGRAATARKVRLAPEPAVAANQICGPY